MADSGQDLGVIRGKRYRLLRFMLEQIKLLVEKICGCGHHSRACVGGVELDRLRRDFLRGQWLIIEAEDPAKYGKPGELAARPRVQRIERDRLA